MVEQEFLEWKRHPVTERFFLYLKDKRTAILEAWASGEFTTEHVAGTAQKNAEALGTLQAITGILNLEADDLAE